MCSDGKLWSWQTRRRRLPTLERHGKQSNILGVFRHWLLTILWDQRKRERQGRLSLLLWAADRAAEWRNSWVSCTESRGSRAGRNRLTAACQSVQQGCQDWMAGISQVALLITRGWIHCRHSGANPAARSMQQEDKSTWLWRRTSRWPKGNRDERGPGFRLAAHRSHPSHSPKNIWRVWKSWEESESEDCGSHVPTELSVKVELFQQYLRSGSQKTSQNSKHFSRYLKGRNPDRNGFHFKTFVYTFELPENEWAYECACVWGEGVGKKGRRHWTTRTY